MKATGDRTRAHFLSADQCRPPPGTIGILASLFVETTGGGMSLQELLGEIERRLAADGDLMLKVQGTVAESLGEALPTALAMRFDERLARASLQLYDLAVVPAVREGVAVFKCIPGAYFLRISYAPVGLQAMLKSNRMPYGQPTKQPD